MGRGGERRPSPPRRNTIVKAFCLVWVMLFLGLLPVAMRWDKRLKALRLLRNLIKDLNEFRLGMIKLNAAAISAGKSIREIMVTIKGIKS